MSDRPTLTTAEARPPLRLDIVAGLTAAAVVLPKAMAYATVAGLPVAAGLYTALVPMAIYGLLGTSRVLSVSSTATLAILAGTELAQVVPDGDPARLVTATATLAAVVGIILLVAALLRLGFVAYFISTPVLTGFKAGIAIVIILDQVPKLLGLHIEKQGFFRDVIEVVRHLPEASWLTLLVAAASFAVLVLLNRFRPHSPAPLVALALAILASRIFHLDALGVAIVGLIPKGLPHLSLPDLDLVAAVAPGALGIALMSFTETIAAGRAFANVTDPPIVPGRELIATGAANLGGAFFGAMPAGGGTSQTAVVRASGGRTQVASLVTAGAAAATMLLFAPILGLLPQATLAAVVIYYSMELIKVAEFRAIRRVRLMEFQWALVACLGVLLLGTLRGITAAVILSGIALASHTAHPRLSILGRKRDADVLRPLTDRHPDDETYEGLLVVRVEGSLFFLNVEDVAARLAQLVEQHQPRVLVLDMSRVPDLEYTALDAFLKHEIRAGERGASLWLAGLNPDVLEMVRRSGLAERLGPERMFYNARAAIARYQELYGSTGG